MSDAAMRVLVADDERGMREGCRRILAQEGFEVETAADGKEALQTFERCDGFCAALVDLRMPRMGGMELVQALRARDRDMLVVVITAHAAIETAVEATKRGAYGYVPKPFTPDELMHVVRNGLEHRSLEIEARRLRREREDRMLELAYEKTKSNTIINCMTDGVLVINADAQVVLLNAAARRLLPEWECLALPAGQGNIACAELTGLLDEALGSKAFPSMVSREIALDGRVHMVNASPVFEPEGRSVGAVAVLRDVTAARKLQTAKSMFVSMVAHEIKAPLAAIENYITVILGRPPGSDPEGDRAKLERCALRASALRQMVSDLTNLSAIETGNFTLRFSPMALGEVLRETVEPFAEQAAGRRIQLSFEPERDAPTVKVLADRDAVAAILRNLLDNAIKYTHEGGRVRVRLSDNECFLMFAVEDTGIGMTPQEIARVFDEFYRARNRETAAIAGTGLGLSIVRRLVEMHQGRIRVEATPGKGSTFTVSLPVLGRA